MQSRELSSRKVENEIFLGLELGMDKKSFYEKCWDLNEKGLITNSPSEVSVVDTATMGST
ncbi:hypothetical protein SYJ56_10145 [Algoriphagus sp. D3-2-R+10]|uniref:hypothetical protein n=1 Tax=Algoriphagus aurantiacus TaxID=3103948 RepID=UPI002B376C0A|nr:hypothetical protein [Algoriphagus sp. D3-2-R+10]MEB2775668.1 hypothetical protein [Algoriphagus sp. D3-2-R+10]